MAWQVKVKYTKTDGIATESIGEEVKNLFNQYKQDGFILNVDTENTNDNERIDTMTFLSESKTGTFKILNILDTVVFPIPIEPVMPIIIMKYFLC